MNLSAILENALAAVAAAADVPALEDVRVEYFGKKGSITELLKSLGAMDAETRKVAGQQINELKQQVQDALNARRDTMQQAVLLQKLASEQIDISLPGRTLDAGGLHPVTRTIRRIESFFGELGFETKHGPEIEDDFHNFDALNIPEHHPARADHDTFYFNPKLMLRTQTSGVQIRTMETEKPPL